jgi:hypothetical protein
MLFGIGFLSVLTATVASHFVQVDKSLETEEMLAALARIEEELCCHEATARRPSGLTPRQKIITPAVASYSALPEPMLARSGRLPTRGDYAHDRFRAIVSVEVRGAVLRCVRVYGVSAEQTAETSPLTSNGNWPWETTTVPDGNSVTR